MKVFAMDGFYQAGKAAFIEGVIKELKKRNYTVGLVKGGKAADYFGIWRESSADPIGFVSDEGQTLIYQKKLTLEQLLGLYDEDFVLLTDMPDFNGPHILALGTDSLRKPNPNHVLALVGENSQEAEPMVKVFKDESDMGSLVDLIEEKVFEKLPDFPQKCCFECGYSCRELCAAILRGDATREDCAIQKNAVSIKVQGHELVIVPFVQKLLNNAVRAVASELEGYRENGIIEVKLGK